MTNKLLDLIKAKYPISELDVGEFATLKANGMKFSVSAYKAEGLGHVSVMTAKGFFGLMRMDTLIVNPTEKDLPLYSYDRIFAMGNDTLIVELYDTMLEKYDDAALELAKSKYATIPERDPGEHWYDNIKLSSSISKKGKREHTPALDKLTLEHFEVYVAFDAATVENSAAKKEKASVYVNGLLEKGGPSTDVFKKNLGIEKTTKLFKEILFGTV